MVPRRIDQAGNDFSAGATDCGHNVWRAWLPAPMTFAGKHRITALTFASGSLRAVTIENSVGEVRADKPGLYGKARVTFRPAGMAFA